MTKKSTALTLTIGIPAHNESQNIQHVLRSVLSQQGQHFILEQILVVCDGCTDNTASLARQLQKKYAPIKVIDDGKRLGKAQRLNYIHQQTRSEAVLVIDADVVFVSTGELDKLCAALQQHSEALVVGPRYFPYPARTFAGKCAVYSYLSFEDAILHFNGGQNIFALMGCCSLVRTTLAKKVQFPVGTISDQNYLYLSALQQRPQGFYLEKSAGVYFRTVATFRDWWILSARSVRGDREDVIGRFGEWVRDIYTMPRGLFARSLIRYFFKQPLYTTGSVLLNILIRLFPYQQAFIKPGVWQTAVSSKMTIEEQR